MGKERQLVVHLVLSQAIQQVYLSRVILGASGKRKTISCAPGIANDDHTEKSFFSCVVVVGTIGKLCREQQSVVHLTVFVIV